MHPALQSVLYSNIDILKPCLCRSTYNDATAMRDTGCTATDISETAAVLQMVSRFSPQSQLSPLQRHGHGAMAAVAAMPALKL